MQFSGQSKPPGGVVYVTPMNRPDAALALALLYGLEGKREARTAAVAVCGGSLGAAAYCDVLMRFYLGTGPFMNSNRILPVGLAAEKELPADSPAVKAALEHRDEKGQEVFVREIRQVSDTSEVRAMIRNALTGQPNGNVTLVLSADPADLFRTLELPGVRELVTAKVRTLVAVERQAGDMKDLGSLWPTPVVLCGAELGEMLPYPGASIEKDFAWAPAHPVVDFYRASGTMPFDSPGWDLAAMLFATRPDAGLFQVTEQKTLGVATGQQKKIIETFVELASAKPVPRSTPRRRDPAQTPPPPPPPPTQQKKTP